MSKVRDYNDSSCLCDGRQSLLGNCCDSGFRSTLWASVQESANEKVMGCVELCPNQLLEVTRHLRDIDEKFHSFRKLFQSSENSSSAALSGPVEVKLTDLLQVIFSFLSKYPALSCHAIQPATASLITCINDLNSQQPQRGTENKRYSEIFRSLDALEITIGNEAVDMFIGEAEDNGAEIPNPQPEKLQTDESSYTCEANLDARKPTNISVEEADEILIKCDGGVEAALDYAKMWCKYVKELLNWEDKRLSYEIEFAKNIMKIAEAGRNAVYSQKYMPLHGLYTKVMEHDIRTGNLAIDTAGVLHDREYYEPLWAKRNEIEKWRKEFKDQWQKEQKRMDYSLSSMRKSRLHYIQRCEELEKAKALSAKAEEELQGLAGSGNKQLEKRRRYRDEVQMKVNESEVIYKASVFDANSRRVELEKVRERIISHIRKLVYQGDEVLTRVTLRMFKLQHGQAERIPEGYEHLTEVCKPYKSGEKYLEFIQNQQKKELPIEVYKFKEFVTSGHRSPSSGRRKNVTQYTRIAASAVDSSSGSLEEASGKPSSTSSEQSTSKSYSDTESLGGSITEFHSFDSPTSSPGHSKLLKAPSTGTVSSSEDCEDKDLIHVYENELIEASSENGLPHYAFKNINPSSAAHTHRLRKLRGPSKCRECENFMVNGLECEECFLTCHKKCLESLLINCGHQKLPARVSLFGIDFTQVPRDFPEEVPFLVVKCTSEIEARALGVQGIYRISGAKARMERLCQAFENGRGLVELSDHSPHDITGVLKHFLKELSSPVLPYKLYDEFMTHAKNLHSCKEPEDRTGSDSEKWTDPIKNTKNLLSKLSATNYNTLRHLIAHLFRVSENYEENKMSPNNLGIIFGPTLIRPPLGNDVSMSCLVDSGYQSQLVEFLILNYERIFGMDDLPSSGLCERDNSLRGANVNESQSSNERDFEVSSENPASKPSLDDSFTEDCSSTDDRQPQCTLQTDAVYRDTMEFTSEDGAESRHSPLDPDSISSQTRGRFSRMPVKHPRTVIPKVPSLPLLTATLSSQQAISDLLESSPSSRSASPDTRGNRKHFETAKHTPETARIVSKLQAHNGSQDCSQPELGTQLCKKPVDAPTPEL